MSLGLLRRHIACSGVSALGVAVVLLLAAFGLPTAALYALETRERRRYWSELAEMLQWRRRGGAAGGAGGAGPADGANGRGDAPVN